MQILVDADSLAPRLREIIARAAARTGSRAWFAANRRIPLPPYDPVEMVVVADADSWLAARAQPGDLVITRDVPLAKRVIEAGATAITDRGETLTAVNIATRLSEREFAMSLRASGSLDAPRKPYDERDKQAFANALDRFLVSARGT